MNKNLFSLLFLLFCALMLAVPSVAAQNLLEDNPHARRARDLRLQAEQLIEEGLYEQALALAAEADRERERAIVWAEEQVWAFRANSMRNRAREQMIYATRIDAATHYPEEHALAMTTMEEAEEHFAERRFEESFPLFRLVRDTISPLRPVREAREPRQEMITPPLERETLPATYVVRLIPERRDSFYRIAGYDFIYGDSSLWPILYEANRHILRDPENPHLIHPGMEFRIPNRPGEDRQGVWQPPGK
ncbi:hypothetical protein AU468_11510 [Alkalispirochaeta sphaeroplastigenens]|uniref:LysM domain-containing protein n=1 Tax=Alkalispirochaeta sphaeroplastigenens TaxID=1187066 RepID=A0A2S4JHH6_9SPIO|nr:MULTISPECIES: hypothetical protein [Alkalispirochaeta]POQ99007.1 hypothetical protein AU468_11510 [Alkalispirochaeta sphaeroplastigenens]